MQTSSAPGLLKSRLVGAAFALLTVVVFAPDAAGAGCLHPQSEGADHFNLLRSAGALVETGRSARPDESHAMPRPGPGGCTGPYCSNRSDEPLLPSVEALPRMSQWAVLDIPPPMPSAGWSPLCGDDGDARPVLAPDAIFHPPR